jgi:molybdopterin-guanine dinucleotide biosynthesis protein A
MENEIDLHDTTLAILAGGRGTRMGLPKAMLRLAGKPILQYLLDAINWPGETLLVTAPGREHPPGYELFNDEVTDPLEQGPLRGILTALEHCKTTRVAIITLDMPALSRGHLAAILDRLAKRPDLLALMLKRADGSETKVEPFPFACNAIAIDPVRTQVNAGKLAVHNLTNLPGFGVEPAPADWPSSVWTNLNYPEDYQRFTAIQDRHT